MALGRPLYEQTDPTRIAGVRRDVERLKRRGAGRWIYVGTYPGDPNTTPDSPPFQNGFHNNGDGTLTADQLTRFCWPLGGPLPVVQINIAGGAVGLVIFSLPAGYWNDGKQTFAGVAHDGSPTSYTIVPNGVGADVYLGRV